MEWREIYHCSNAKCPFALGLSYKDKGDPLSVRT